MIQTSCRYFNGYKPCNLNPDCDESCPLKDTPRVSILVVHLGALGAVLRSTALLMPMKRKYPSSRITWVTESGAQALLQKNQLIDRILTTSHEDLLSLNALDFDIAFIIDKSLKAVGVYKQAHFVEQVYGFISQAQGGGIIPANDGAQELWEIGLSDKKKFHENKKTENQLILEALELGPYQRDEYVVHFSSEENEIAEIRRASWHLNSNQSIIGINTGASSTHPGKKWTVEYQRNLIIELQKNGFENIVLLGGPEDTLRNQKIAYKLNVFQSPTEKGLRDGLLSIQACDAIITGDSLGMHMAIALKKWLVAWFGPTCAHEVELYGRGMKILTSATCSPCWKRDCQKNPMCYDLVPVKEVIDGLEKYTHPHRSNSIFR